MNDLAYYLILLVVVIAVGLLNPKRERPSARNRAVRRKEPKTDPQREEHKSPVSRSRALASLIGCIPVMTVGLTMLIAFGVMGAPVPMAIGGGLTILALVRMLKAGEDFRAGRQQAAPRKPKPAPTFRSDAPDHEHITLSGPSTQRQLEQLDRLLDAGLLDKEEYQEKRRELDKTP